MEQHPLKRYDGWDRLLTDYLESRQEAKFAYGEHDCLLFVADGVYRMTGIDIAAHLRTQYQSTDDLVELFGKNWIRRLDELYFVNLTGQGFEAIDVKQAMRGDIVMHKGEVFAALGLCGGMYSYFLGPQGYTVVETLKCHQAWRV